MHCFKTGCRKVFKTSGATTILKREIFEKQLFNKLHSKAIIMCWIHGTTAYGAEEIVLRAPRKKMG